VKLWPAPLLAAGLIVAAVILAAAASRSASLTWLECSLLLLALFVLAWHFLATRRRLHTLAELAERMSGSASTQDEIARVLAALDRIAPRLQQSSAELDHADQMRRDFVANVSHELRTPLASIQGYAETLLDTARDKKEREFLEIIRRNALRMSRLSEDLLTLARVESGEQQFTFAPTIVSELLQDVESACRPLAASKQIQLDLEQIVPWAVLADAEAIHRVFENLIQNAINYSGSSRIAIGAREQARTIEFYVRDFGRGIPAEHLPRLFERFYRVDAARSRELGGTGLGLAIAKHVVLAHGGEIRVESLPGNGTTFFFTLPIAGGRR
jgi:signal transduction histidine kinase